MSIKLIASDIDGTIVDENNFISPENINAINDINNKHISFAVCTGKSYAISKALCSKFNASYGIFGNGSHVVDLKTGKSIYKHALSLDEIKTCIEFAKRHNLHMHAYTDNEIITPELKYMDLRNYKLNLGKGVKFLIADDLYECIVQNHLEILQIAISSDNSLKPFKHELEENNNFTITTFSKFGEYKDLIIDKEYEYISIAPKDTNKDSALRFLKQYLGLDNSEVMAIGDNLNDKEMLQNSGVSVAIANAYDEVKKIASYTTKNNVSQGGFAEGVYRFINFDDKK